MLFDRGYIQVYTGDGKGKTTAAFGLALRCADCGGRVFIAQFLKGRDSSERDGAQRLGIEVENFGEVDFITGEPSETDITIAREAFTRVRTVILSGEYDMVILDEINTALHIGLIHVDDVLGLIADKPLCAELVLTGSDAPDELIEAADLVTNMKKLKHYYEKGVPARRGIEE